jgi:hypothetical protein
MREREKDYLRSYGNKECLKSQLNLIKMFFIVSQRCNGMRKWFNVHTIQHLQFLWV